MILRWAFLFAMFFAVTLAADDSFPKGQTVDPVTTVAKINQHYALYLPANYSTDRKWPILYGYDARGNGSFVVELFREAAEKYGWIIAASNNTRSDEPYWPNGEAMTALWDDTHQRLALDENRIYATGFSGGSRLAWGLGFEHAKSVAGIIGCSGGILVDYPPSKNIHFAYFGTTGVNDFNFQEMLNLDEQLAKLKVPHRLGVFEGGHEWPPQPLATEAVEWLELRAMHDGKAPKNTQWIEDVHSKLMKKAQALKDAGKLYSALSLYRQIHDDFEGLAETKESGDAIAALKDSEIVKSQQKQIEEQRKEEEKFRQKMPSMFAALQSKDPKTTDKILKDLKIEELKARASADTEAGMAARRLLQLAFVQFSSYMPDTFLRQKDYARAVNSLDVATRIKETATVWYNLACAYSQLGEASNAIDALRKAVDQGFTDRAHIENDPDLAKIRNEQGYREIISGLK